MGQRLISGLDKFTFKDYYRLTKITTVTCFKIFGAIFTSIYVLIAIITGYKNESVLDLLEIFAISFLLGNSLGVFIWFLAISSGFQQSKSTVKFFNTIPAKIREKFGLQLIEKPQDSRYNYLNFHIISTNSETPSFFGLFSGKKEVFITIANEFYENINFQKKMLEIQKKYKKQKITLTGWGLRKTFELKKWEMMKEDEIDGIINELLTISGLENLKVYKRHK